MKKVFDNFNNMRFISFILFWFPLTTATNSIYTPCEFCMNQATENELEEIELRLYTGLTIDINIKVQVGDVLDLLDAIDINKPTVVYVFGWIGYANQPSTTTIINAYLARGDHNTLLFDWSIVSLTDYLFAIKSAKSVGYTLATALNKLVAAGLNSTGIHIIGHSLGAQVCGYAGRFMNFSLPRITGLDPASLGFYFIAETLTYTDAEFVDIIHTDRYLLGLNTQTGNADFYPNNGISNQPGCLVGFTICSHYRACYYYAESVQYEDSFIGLSCDSYSNYKNGLCSSNPTAIMGYATSTKARGSYYLQTNSESPYGRKEVGLIYEDSGSVIDYLLNLIPFFS